jgi:hypothetical protein
MNDIQIFIVFHKNIFDECYKNIPDDILYKYFTFLAVNENIAKYYTQNKYKVINEWELPIYDKTFQDRGYNENSAIYHVYANNLHKDYKYIGFFQYDMRFNDNIIDFLQKNIPEIPSLFSFSRYDFNFCNHLILNEPNTLNYIIKDFENFYNKSFTKNYQYPLFNSYIIPNETYEKIMRWVIQLYDKMYPWCINPPNASHFGHIGGIYERIMAFAVGEECLNYINIDINLSHDHKYKNLSY